MNKYEPDNQANDRRRDCGPGPRHRGGGGGRGGDPGFFGPEGPFGPRGPRGPFGPGEQGWSGGSRHGHPGHPGHGERRGRGPRGRARRGDVRAAALGLLAEEPLNGYQIIQTLAERTEGRWRPSPGSIYPVLAQLEDEGLVEPFEEEGRKAYRLTDTGRGATEALGERARPWEAGADRSRSTGEDRRDADPGPVGGMWKEYAQLGMATRAVDATGDEHLYARAVELLGQTRRSLYRLLADETHSDSGDIDDGPADTQDVSASRDQ